MIYILIVGVIVFIDRITKKYFSTHLAENEKRSFFSGRVFITNSKNSGAAYGLFEKNPKLLFVSTLIAIFSMLKLLKEELSYLKPSKLKLLSFSMIFGGAIGNIIDRVKSHQVTDFLCINVTKNAAIFNFADVSILIGVLFQIISFFKSNRK